MAESSREPRSWRPLRRAALVLIGLVTVGAPLVIGGVLPPVFVASALLGGFALLLTLVGRRDRVPISPFGWVLLGGAVLAALSAVPLPIGTIAQLAPRAFAFSSLPGEAHPATAAWSLDPPASVLAIARMAGLLTVFLASACLAGRPDQARWLARIIAWAGLGICFVAIGHLALGINEVYGIYAPDAAGRGFTVFLDANHAASLGILSTLACLGLVVNRVDPLERWGWLAGAVLCALMTISTQSVAGLTTFAIALGGFVVLQFRRKAGLTGKGALVQPLLVGLGVIVVLLALIGAGILLTDSVDFIMGKGRAKIAPWLNVLQLVRESWKTGVGPGAFSAAFEAFMPAGHVYRITHAENFVLHWLAEWGVPATCIALVAIPVTFWKILAAPAETDDRLGGIHDALFAATVAVLLHDLADFGLEFDGVGLSYVVAMGVLVAHASRPSGRRWHAAVIGFGAIAAAFLAARFALPHQVRVQIQEAELQSFNQKATAITDIYRKAIRLHPADPTLPVKAAHILAQHSTRPGTQAERRASLESALMFLERAEQLSQNELAYLNRAWILAQLKRRPEAMVSLREAFRRGRLWDDVTRMALGIGVSPSEMADLLPGLRDIDVGPGGKIDLVSTATEAIFRQTPMPSQRRRVADAILSLVDQKKVAGTPTVLDVACRALTNDAFCSRTTTYGCDQPEDADAISAKALTLGTDWIRREPSEPLSYQCAARAYWSFGAAEERARVLATAVARIPDDASLRAALAVSLVDSGQPGIAIEEVKNLIPENQEPAVAESIYLARARAYWMMGKRGKALRQVDDAVRLNPESLWAYTLATRYHEFAAQFDQALTLLEQVRHYTHGKDSNIDEWRSNILEEKREWESDPRNITNKARSTDDASGVQSSDAGSAAPWKSRARSARSLRFMDIEIQLQLAHAR